MRWLGLLLLALFLNLVPFHASVGFADYVGEYELKSAYRLKFTQFTDWPEETFAEFRICVLGKSPFGSELGKLQEKNRRGIPVKVSLVSTMGEAKQCQAVFLNPTSETELSSWVETLGTQPVLTISDHPDAFGSNVMIALTTEPNRVTFRSNNHYAQARGLQFSALLLQLALQVR